MSLWVTKIKRDTSGRNPSWESISVAVLGGGAELHDANTVVAAIAAPTKNFPNAITNFSRRRS